jgi:flavin-dependent dehydrogenase
MADFDIIVVGGGHSGSTCARLLADNHHSVLLVDKEMFPRSKVSQDAIASPLIKPIIQKFDLGEKWDSKNPNPIYSVHIHDENGTILKLSPSPKNNPLAYVLPRATLDNLLFENATKHCSFREGMQLVGFEQGGKQTNIIRLANLSSKKVETFSCDILVGADGSYSWTAKKFGVNEIPSRHAWVNARGYFTGIEIDPHTVHIHLFDDYVPGYFWIVPVDEKTVNAGAGLPFDFVQRYKIDVPAIVEEFLFHPRLEKTSFNVKIKSPVEMETVPCFFSRRKIVFERALLIGEAAALTNPLTGSATNSALKSAELASEIIHEELQKKHSTLNLHHYENRIYQTLEKRMKDSLRMKKFGSVHWLRKRVLQKASQNPKTAGYFTELLLQKKSFSYGDLTSILLSRN